MPYTIYNTREEQNASLERKKYLTSILILF